MPKRLLLIRHRNPQATRLMASILTPIRALSNAFALVIEVIVDPIPASVQMLLDTLTLVC